MIVVQIFDLLLEMKKLGFYHNDLHIGNILWDERRRRIWLIDYGLACLNKPKEYVMFDCRFVKIEIGNYKEFIEWFVELLRMRGSKIDLKLLPILETYLHNANLTTARHSLDVLGKEDEKLKEWLSEKPICS